MLYSAPTAVAIIGLFVLAETLRWPDWLTAVATGVLAALVIAIVVRNVVRTGPGVDPAQPQRLVRLHRLHRGGCWNLWFFSFWSVQIVKESAQSSLVAAGLTAAFNAGAGIIGFPVLAGWLTPRPACISHASHWPSPARWRTPCWPSRSG